MGMSITAMNVVRMATGIDHTIRMYLTAVRIFQVCLRSEGHWVRTVLVEQRSRCDKVTSLESQPNCKRGDFSQLSRLLRRKSLTQLVAGWPFWCQHRFYIGNMARKPVVFVLVRNTSFIKQISCNVDV